MSPVNGVLGITRLTSVPWFYIFLGIVPDLYIHYCSDESNNIIFYVKFILVTLWITVVYRFICELK